MYFLLDSSTPLCRMIIVRDGVLHRHEWEAGRALAHQLLARITEALAEYDATLADIKGLGAFRGPGSFTGLRIGLTVLNTIADDQNIPIVGTQGDEWQNEAIARLDAAQNDAIVMPFYGREARVTAPRK